MFLQTSRHGNIVTLNWNKYEGINFNQVYLRRGTNAGNIYQTIKVLNASQTSFTDTVSKGTYYYQLAIYTQNGNEILSNYVTTGMAEETPGNVVPRSFAYSVFPNPSENGFNIKLSSRETRNMQVKVYDLKGVEVYSWSAPAVKEEVSHELLFTGIPGIYIMEVSNGITKERIKLVKK
jgi:hypothetical protein